MNVRRVLNIFKLDTLNSRRDKVMIYTLLAPIILTIVFKLISPDFQSLSIDFVVPENAAKLAVQLDRYANVEQVASIQEMKDAVARGDDRIGVYESEGKYVLVMQGDESPQARELAELAISAILEGDTSLINIDFSDNGRVIPPITLFGFSFVVILSFTLGGFIIGFSIIEEKESGAMRALMVTPISKAEFLLGRSIMGISVPIVHALLAVLIFAIGGLDILKLIMVTVVSSVIGIVMGFLIGVMSSSQMTGLANMKISVLLLLMPVMIAFVLPENRQFIFYWSPTYWSFAALKDILTRNAEWGGFLLQLLWISLTTGLLFLLMRGKIKSGLKTYQS
jgi:ABC-2 type transport system permease protein